MQLNEHDFAGTTSTPSDNPNRRDGTGPYTYFMITLSLCGTHLVPHGITQSYSKTVPMEHSADCAGKS
jgi:hypothetical protein